MKLPTILSLMLISSTVFAGTGSVLGHYSAPSGVRFFGYTKEDCTDEMGEFNEQDGACYQSAENTISIV